jgi:hypothetical protein
MIIKAERGKELHQGTRSEVLTRTFQVGGMELPNGKCGS